MIARERRLAGAALLVVVGLLAAVSGRPEAAAIAAALLVLAMLLGPRVGFGPAMQRLAAATAAGLGIALALAGSATASLIPPGLDRIWVAAALALLFAATTRLVVRAPEGGALATAILGLLALMTVGETAAGAIYKIAVGAHLAFALLALRAADPGRPPLSALPRRAFGVGAGLVCVAAALGVTATRALAPMSDWTAAHIALPGGSSVTSGFGDHLWLGSLEGMLQSEEVVLRIEGARPDYLRGAVFDHYELGRWSNAFPGGGLELEPSRTPPSGPASVTMTLAGGERDRYFLPLGARAIAADDDGVLVDRFGTLRLLRGAAQSVRFELAKAPELHVAEPTAEDLRVPEDLRPIVTSLAAAWTSGLDDPARKVEAIERRLQQGFVYSLEFHQRHREALLDFLREERRGHCEYFASAMTMLARAAGVPARVVTGYRVVERSRLGSYWIVREKNAHAWTEVYLPGRGFVTVDATPIGSESLPRALGLAAALRDLAAASWSKANAAAGGQLARLALGAAALGLGVVTVARRLLRRRRIATRRGRHDAADRPLPSLVRLLEALARRGLERAPSEPLERFAARLDAAELGGVAALLRRYAAQRYGDVGELDPLLGEIDACATELRAPLR